jgi:hypothetical protein
MRAADADILAGLDGSTAMGSCLSCSKPASVVVASMITIAELGESALAAAASKIVLIKT